MNSRSIHDSQRRGVAEELAESGVTTYVTGRSIQTAGLPAGCVALPCDHKEDDQAAAAVASGTSQSGRIDILVNSVWGAYEQMVENGEFTWGLPFWQQPFGGGMRCLTPLYGLLMSQARLSRDIWSRHSTRLATVG